MLGWRPSQTVEVRLVGQNLLQARHPEFKDGLAGQMPTEVERSVYLKLNLNF